jgi:hypothetical protein
MGQVTNFVAGGHVMGLMLKACTTEGGLMTKYIAGCVSLFIGHAG